MAKYKVNDIVECKITGIEDYGIFVAIDDKYSGLIHISQISNSFVKNISDYVSMDEVIKARIIDIDEKEKKMKLSIINVNYNDDELQFIENNTDGFNSLKENLSKWMKETLNKIDKE